MSKNADTSLIGKIRKHRVGLGPFFVAVPVLILGVAANFATSPWLLLLVLAATASGILAFVFQKFEKGTWRRRYWMGLVTLGSVWILWAATLSTFRGWEWALGTLFSVAVLYGIPHWVDSVPRRQVQMEQVISDWPIKSARIGLSGTLIRNMTVTSIGWTAKLQWPDGLHLPKHMTKMEEQIGGALGLDMNQLKIDFDGRSSSSVILNVTLNDPHAQGIAWSIPVTEKGEEAQIKTLHGSDKFIIGVRSDGTEKTLQMFVPGWGARNALIAGTKGSGKSGLLSRIWAHFTLCDDVVQWGVDLKGGVELGPWEGTFDWIVNTREDAVAMMAAAAMLVDNRARLMKKRGWKSWQGSPEHPWVAISIDEAASLLGDASAKEMKFVEEIARKGRASGVALLFATQYPTLDAMGSSQVREQIDQRFCFRMATNKGEGFVIEAGVVNADALDPSRPGTCYHQDGDKLDRLPMRIVFVGDGSNGTDNTVKRLVSVMRGLTPGMDRDSIADGIAQLEQYANREKFSPSETTERDSETDGSETVSPEGDDVSRDSETDIPEWSESHGTCLADLVSRERDALTPEEQDKRDSERAAARDSETTQLSNEDAVQALMEGLRSAGPKGASVSALAELATRKKTWTYERLNELAEQGAVCRTVNGGWAEAGRIAGQPSMSSYSG
jgi:S-DNA-T family DNA segregation ATPase FtsK/SpoIIIE